MSARGDAVLAAIVANVAAAGTRWMFEPRAVVPMRPDGGHRMSADTVRRHMRVAGYAVDAGPEWMELTAAGLAAIDALDAVEAARAVLRGGVTS